MILRKGLKIGKNGHLVIGGVDVSLLRETYGTPLYVLDQEYIEKVATSYVSALKNEYGEGLIAYASKAFSCKEIYRLMNSLGLGADVVSGGELFTALSVDFPTDKLVFHGNNKTEKELTEAIKAKVGRIVIDSLDEIDIIDEIAKEYGIVQKVMLRVNVGVEAHTHHYIQTAKADSKFGFSIFDKSAKIAIEKIRQKKNLLLSGLHSHIGSQIFEEKSFVIATNKLVDFYKNIKDEYGIEFDEINLGGGFGIYYAEDDKKTDETTYYDFVKSVTNAIKSAVLRTGIKKPFLILEPGRSIVGEAGITLYTVGAIKHIENVKDYISIDGGMFDNPRYALYQAKYTVALGEKMNSTPNFKYSVAGKCCESGDIIAEDCLLPEAKKGDIAVVFSTGAYNYSMASNYNRNLIPPVIMVKDGKSRYIVKPQTYEDIIRNDI